MDLSSVPSSTYPVRQSVTKRTEIHRVPQFICKPNPLEVVLSRKEPSNRSVTVPRKRNASHCTHLVSLALESWLSSLRFSLWRNRKLSQSRIERSVDFRRDPFGRLWSQNWGIQQFRNCCVRRTWDDTLLSTWRCCACSTCSCWNMVNISYLIGRTGT